MQPTTNAPERPLDCPCGGAAPGANAHARAPRRRGGRPGARHNPQLLADRGRVYLSWRTRNDGYRLIDVEGQR